MNLYIHIVGPQFVMFCVEIIISLGDVGYLEKVYSVGEDFELL